MYARKTYALLYMSGVPIECLPAIPSLSAAHSLCMKRYVNLDAGTITLLQSNSSAISLLENVSFRLRHSVRDTSFTLADHCAPNGVIHCMAGLRYSGASNWIGGYPFGQVDLCHRAPIITGGKLGLFLEGSFEKIAFQGEFSGLSMTFIRGMEATKGFQSTLCLENWLPRLFPLHFHLNFSNQFSKEFKTSLNQHSSWKARILEGKAWIFLVGYQLHRWLPTTLKEHLAIELLVGNADQTWWLGCKLNLYLLKIPYTLPDLSTISGKNLCWSSHNMGLFSEEAWIQAKRIGTLLNPSLRENRSPNLQPILNEIAIALDAKSCPTRASDSSNEGLPSDSTPMASKESVSDSPTNAQPQSIETFRIHGTRVHNEIKFHKGNHFPAIILPLQHERQCILDIARSNLVFNKPLLAHDTTEEALKEAFWQTLDIALQSLNEHQFFSEKTLEAGLSSKAFTALAQSYFINITSQFIGEIQLQTSQLTPENAKMVENFQITLSGPENCKALEATSGYVDCGTHTRIPCLEVTKLLANWIFLGIAEKTNSDSNHVHDAILTALERRKHSRNPMTFFDLNPDILI